MEWIAGFAWALPRAFAGAVSACRFELGDVLCRDREAVSRWSANDPPTGPILQVLDPPKSARAISADAEGSRFEINWDSPVTLDRHQAGQDAPVRVETTQGRLYACLWRDAPEALDPAAPVVSPPRGLRDLHREITHAIPAFRARFGRKKKSRAGDPQLFVFATDDASDVSRVKARAMEGLLDEAFTTNACTLTPAEADVPDADTLRPSLLLRGILVSGADAGAIEQRLAGLLYGGASDEARRFSLLRHGHLTALSPPADPEA